MNHPIQPLATDEHGVLRFRQNKIVRDMLDFATPLGFSMNTIACKDYTDADRQQFAQLIGYSLDGYGSLSSYVDDVAYQTAALLAEPEPMTEETARIAALELELFNLRGAIDALRKPMAVLFGMHEDDLSH